MWLPVFRNHDSFPLSTQPMYATARDRTETLASAVGINSDGERQRLSLSLIATTDDPLVAEALLENAIISGQTSQLCDEIAGRVAGQGSEDLVTIEVVSEEVDLIDWVGSVAPPLDRTVHASCEVGVGS